MPLVSGITQYLPFRDWLLPVTAEYSSVLLGAPARVGLSCLRKAVACSFLHRDRVWFLRASLSGRPGCLHLVAVVNSAATNLRGQKMIFSSPCFPRFCVYTQKGVLSLETHRGHIRLSRTLTDTMEVAVCPLGSGSCAGPHSPPKTPFISLGPWNIHGSA